ncbi:MULTISPECIES: hypothetical protein [unclassified Variovorax]|uniref:hypothetical protein n=1 Tax=unclassified Variovorax TaxID=663243 RepID=UPI003F4651C9
MKNTRLLSCAAGAVVLAAALAGCGGGGGGGGGFYPFPIATTPPPDNQPPVEVSAYDAFVAYVVALVATQSETDDAANVAQFDPPPTSETRDPVATP